MTDNHNTPHNSNDCALDDTDILVISYNMHGYNQGLTALKSLIDSKHPDIFILQEHWLTPSNLYKFSHDIADYTAFGCSAMDNVVSTGPLRGRPFGGLMLLLNKKAVLPQGNRAMPQVFFSVEVRQQHSLQV